MRKQPLYIAIALAVAGLACGQGANKTTNGSGGSGTPDTAGTAGAGPDTAAGGGSAGSAGMGGAGGVATGGGAGGVATGGGVGGVATGGSTGGVVTGGSTGGIATGSGAGDIATGGTGAGGIATGGSMGTGGIGTGGGGNAGTTSVGGAGGIVTSGAGGIGTGGSKGTGGIGTGGGRTGGTGGAGVTGGTTSAAGTTGGSAAGGGGATSSGAFPTQACLARANTLLGQMTADEKYAQMLQMERAALTTDLVTQYGVGSGFSQGGSSPATNSPAGWADMADGYRQAALASRLKIPFIYGADEVHGIGTVKGATVFPHNVGLGATGDTALVAQIASITANEALGCGVDFVFSPVVAVALNERWGRTYEAFGETTDLASTNGVTMIKGIQFTATGAATGILACAKHYLGDGGTTNGVNNGQTTGDEATLEAIHLTPYRAAVAAHVGSIMVSYSTWQGTKMHINKTMLTDTLKGTLGFGGFVVSDFNGCLQIGMATQAGLGACLNAGVDMFMTYAQTIPNMLGYFAALVQDGTVPQARVDDAVRRILAVKCEMGLFEATGKVDRTLTAQVGSAAHRQVARQAVQESLVVLKNDGNVLPLAKTATVALGGKSADNTGNQCGGWTITWQGSTGNGVTGATSVRQALESVLSANKVVYSLDGSSVTGASVGIAVIGETPYAEGKGDSADLALDPNDVTVVKTMKQAGLKTVVVLIAGRPRILDSILSYADAIVMAWLPGSEAAGITDILFGDAHPSGKLPHSWPSSMAQIPINYGDATYDPLYAYGFGLTY
jgi:beta-glucosidase